MASRRIAFGILAGAALFAPLSWSALKDSKHNFLSASWNTSGQVCLPCHTPHHANKSAAAPLWDHDETAASFILYASDTLNAKVNQPSGVSRICLGCHDGTVAMNAFGGNTAGSEFLRSGPAFLGTDLSNDHPVSFVYDTTLASDDGDLYNPETATVPELGGKTIQQGMLIRNEMQCTSCHDVHATSSSSSDSGMLLFSNNGSKLCLTCHRK